eukprot:4666032-Lingulodinium_polyedra.AAC.1
MAACSAATDNQGNAAMALKGLTTKPLLAAVWAEICLQATARGLRLSLHWTRRTSNEAADALTNL